MRSALIGFAAGAFLLSLSTAAYADPPTGVGAAITASGFECPLLTVVEPGEAVPIFPGGYGLVHASAPGVNEIVYSNSANGNINLTCHRRIEFGSEITGEDYVTGAEVNVTIAQFDEACDAVSAVFPDVCNGNGVAILNAETVPGSPCPIVPGLFTFDWHLLLAPSGRQVLSCQYVEE